MIIILFFVLKSQRQRVYIFNHRVYLPHVTVIPYPKERIIKPYIQTMTIVKTRTKHTEKITSTQHHL